MKPMGVFNMKKIFTAFVIFVICLSLFGCGKTTENNDTNGNSPTDINNQTSNSLPKHTEESVSTDKETVPNTTGTTAPDTTDQKETTATQFPSDDPNQNTQQEQRNVINYDDMKAVWLSQFDLNVIYTNNGSQRSESDYRNKIKTVIDNMQKCGFNTLIVQTRPYADSFYPSEVYPPSKYVTGSYKKNFSYDPIKILIEEAHNRSLSVQGWINPLRAMTTSEINDVSNDYRIKKWYLDSSKKGLYVVEVSGRLYLNPAYEEVRKLVIDGVDEMLKSYDFDGIHMDDYFYPTTNTSFDQKAYGDYKSGGGKLTLKNFRYDVLNKLVKDIYDKVKGYDKKLLFGISPQGNMSNATDVTLADVKTWCSVEGYIDYICPQIYFGFEHQTQAFDKVCLKWQNIIKTPKVKLIIGMTLGKTLSKTDQWAGSGKNEWANNNDILKRCLEYTLTLDKCKGVAYFCYQYFYDPSTATAVSATKKECDNFIPVLKKADW